MQKTKVEEYRMVSPSLKLRGQRGYGAGHDSVPNPRPSREALDPSPRPPQRSLSPHGKIEASRELLEEEKTGFNQRRDYIGHLGAGQTEKARMGLPQHMHERGRPDFDEGADHKRRDYVEEINENFKSNRTRYVHGGEYRGATSRLVEVDHNHMESRNQGFLGHGIHGQKSVPLEDELERAVYGQAYREKPHGQDPFEYEKLNFLESMEHEQIQLCRSVDHEKFCCSEPTGHDNNKYMDPMQHRKLSYGDHSDHGKLVYWKPTEHREHGYWGTRDCENLHHEGSLEHEKFGNLKHIHPNKLQTMGLHDAGEKLVRNVRYLPHTSRVPASYSKEMGHPAQFKDISGTSSGALRNEFPSSFKEGMSSPACYDYPEGSSEFTQSLDYDPYDRRIILNGRDQKVGKRRVTSYPHGAYRSSRFEHNDYFDPEFQEHISNDDVCPSDYTHRKIVPTCSHLDCEHACSDHEHRGPFRSRVIHPVRERFDHAELAFWSARMGAVELHPSVKERAIENLDASRIQYALKWDGEHLSSDFDEIGAGMRESWDSPVHNSSVTDVHQLSHLRSGYDFGRNAGPRLQNDGMQDMSMYDLEMHGESAKRERMEEELILLEPSARMTKRKYSMVDDVTRHGRKNFLQKGPAHYKLENPYGNDEEWTDGDIGDLHSDMHHKLDSKNYSKTGSYYGPDQPKDSASEDWFSFQDSLVYGQRDSVRHYKSSRSFVKDHSKLHSLGWHNQSQTKRSYFHRQQETYVEDVNYEEDVDEVEDDDGPSECPTEPSEDSDEFKQAVNEAFLMYSKRLNLNAALQRRYREQGKAGSLFCIVCGKRSSKEFLDTQRLVTHAFMSRKVGLRAKHLGLHKAICVLMGWSTFVPPDTTTWVPEALSSSEALVQKEDLILWPPIIIIHNISMSINNPEHQKVVPIDKVSSFIRGKVLVEGKMKAALGKPADQSVILLKFLGTFTGLGNSERIHEYFLANNRGRQEFKQACSSNSKIGGEREAGTEGDTFPEQLLYGYMGVADDLDRLDYNTKQWISIRSKKEIQDLANAPVKTN